MRIVSKHTLGGILWDDVRVNPRVLAGSHAATPWEALAIADEAFATYRLCIANARPGIPTRLGVTLETVFVGPGMRREPNVHYYPCRLSMSAELLRESLTPDVVLVMVRQCEDTGKLSLGTEVNILVDAIEACHENGGIVVAEINPQLPYTYGDGELAPGMIDYAIVVDRPLDSVDMPTATINEKLIAHNVARLVPNGATLQPGIGAVPNEVAYLLDGGNYRVWAEMFSDGIKHLSDTGKLDSSVEIVGSFVFGSNELYAWLDHNPHVIMRRIGYVNDPAMIAHQRKMTAINTALQVDLRAQANASYVNGKIHSGLGGQSDFHIGAMHSKGGAAIMALRAWHPKANVSTIVPRLTEPVTTFQHSYIVTENGVARIAGEDADSQAESLIAIADPRARPELARAHFNRPSIQEV